LPPAGGYAPRSRLSRPPARRRGGESRSRRSLHASLGASGVVARPIKREDGGEREEKGEERRKRRAESGEAEKGEGRREIGEGRDSLNDVAGRPSGQRQALLETM
jgi:hypothetical protein